MAGDVLREMGRFLKQLHEVDPLRVADILPGEGAVVSHGDFAHYNCLMAHDGSRLMAVLDWEGAYLGGAVEDLAWCEWQFRNRYPQHEWAVANLFEGYGVEPDWALREQAIAARLEELRRRRGGESVEPKYHRIRFEQS